MLKAIGVSIAGIIAVFLVVTTLASTKTDTVQAQSHHWRIEQQIEDYQTRYLEGWDETVPSDARDRSCYSRSRGSHRQYTGQTCTGTGNSRICTSNYITIPDSDNWCSYSVDRWAYLIAYVNEGGLNDPIVSPEPHTECTGVQEIGCQRYGAQIRAFTISFLRSSDDSVINCNYDRDYWLSIADGDSYQMIFGTVFNEARCGLQ